MKAFLILYLGFLTTCVVGQVRKPCSYAELYYANLMGITREVVDVFHGHSQKPPCTPSERNSRWYRYMDGTCNHPKDYGATFRPVKRYMKAHYQDKYGIDSPRRWSVTGRPLPSPRLVSWKISPDRLAPSSLTMLVMQMGQIIDHDITSAPVPTETNASIKCCGIPRNEQPKECFTIDIPYGDPSFQDCMEFVRSEYAMDSDGNKIHPREQINALTSFVDGSAFYGNSEEAMRTLRTENGTGAFLRTVRVKGKLRLPKDTRSDCLAKDISTSYCQLAGDERVNEQPGLSSMHLVFHLEHNNIVRSLAKAILRKRNQPPVPWDADNFIRSQSDSGKETLYQEARKILSGIFQKIVYCDWLPIILGPRLVQKYKLACGKHCEYSPDVDPRIASAFLTAAFRFGHSLVPNTMITNSSRGRHLKDVFMIPDDALLYHETITKGLTQTRSQSFDRFVSSSVTKHLFQTKNGPLGALDLVALNIQRGRDHGLPAYFHWREYYRLKRFNRAERMFGYFQGKQVMKIYRDVKDIDLFTGGILERPVQGGMVGETFGHIIANQFRDLKYGDNHFFQCKDLPHGFTAEQLSVIKAASFSKILCTNSDMKRIQKDPFRVASDRNPMVRCKDLPELDLTPWMIFF